MGLEVGREVNRRLMIAPRDGDRQPLGIQVMHGGDVALPFVQVGVVDAHDLHRAHVVQGASLLDVVLDASPQLLVCAAQKPARPEVLDAPPAQVLQTTR